MSFKCGLTVVYIIKPQVDTPWFYQALFITASDHNTLWGSLWEIQMSAWLKINRGSAETWVCLNQISPTHTLGPNNEQRSSRAVKHAMRRELLLIITEEHLPIKTCSLVNNVFLSLSLCLSLFILRLCLWTAPWLYPITSRGMCWGLVWWARKQRGACAWF